MNRRLKLNSTDNSRPKLVHRADIQGLRALAVLSVILYHANAQWLPGGFIGVDLFFVISGFLMTKILRDNTLPPIALLKGFYLARARRIVPAYVVVISVTTISASILLVPADFSAYQNSLKQALLFLSNQYFAEYYDYFGPAAHEQPLLHTWSLAIEVQFYLLYPLALIFIPRLHLFRLVILTALALTAYIFSEVITDRSDAAYFQMSHRIPEFLIGAAAACTKLNFSKQGRGAVATFGALLIIFSFVFANEAQPFGVLAALPACVGAALLIVTRETTVHKALEIKHMRHIGDMSYSMYLWHWPVLTFIRYYRQDYEIPISALLSAGAIIFLLSKVSYQFIERSFWRIDYNPHRIQLQKGAALTAIFFLIVSLAPRINSALDTPLQIELTRYADSSLICHGKILENCYRGDINAQSTILLLGDSHAAQLNYFADVVGENSSTKFIVISASSCVPIPNFDIERIRSSAQEPCLAQSLEIQGLLEAVDGIIIAGKWTSHTKSREFLAAFDNFLNAAQTNNLPVAILSQPPHLSIDPIRLMRFANMGAPTNSSIVESWRSSNSTIREMAGGYPGITFIDTTGLPLFDQAPIFNGNLIYRDEHHLNENGSRLYGHQASSYIESWLSRL